MTDPITDMLNQIKNAKALQKPEVLIPFSNLKGQIIDILAQEGFVQEMKKVVKPVKAGLPKHQMIKVVLKYDNGVPAIEGVKRVSKPGQRIYVKNHDIRKVRGGYGLAIISTPKGLMTNAQAKKAKLGGEVLIEVW